MSSPLTWLITGASNGFGLALSLQALEAGHRVIGTVRDKSKSADAVGKITAHKNGSVIELDMTESRDTIASKLASVTQVDVLVNNAGYSILGACEEINEKDARLQIDTNFFGPLFTTQAILPVMRKQKSGTVVQISSGAAQDPLAACSLYSASKAALEAATEALANEVRPLGINILIVEPGNFRTNFVGALGDASGKPEGVGDDYQGTVGAIMSKFLSIHGKQMGNPTKAAARIFEAVTGQLSGEVNGEKKAFKVGENRRLILGTDAWGRMAKCNDQFKEDIDLCKSIAETTAFEE